jgi:hypothetical protein
MLHEAARGDSGFRFFPESQPEICPHQRGSYRSTPISDDTFFMAYQFARQNVRNAKEVSFWARKGA